MEAISFVIGILVIAVLILVIASYAGGTKVTVVTTDTDTGAPPLPGRTPEELAAMQEALPTRWVTYMGSTPPLKLEIRGQDYESYRRVMRKHLDGLSEGARRSLTETILQMLNLHVVADAYVIDWASASYSNGNPMPYSPANLVAKMIADPPLVNFITENARAISPPWPSV